MKINQKPFENYGRERTEFLDYFGFMSVRKPKDMIYFDRKKGSVR